MKDQDKVLLGIAKEFSSLSVMINLCKGQGFLDVDIRYVGDMWVLLDFPYVRACTNYS